MVIFIGKTHYKWPCSIAMSNYQRVNSLSIWQILPVLEISDQVAFGNLSHSELENGPFTVDLTY